MTNMLHIAGYKFLVLTNLPDLQKEFREAALRLNLRGTVLLSEEGININLSGCADRICDFKQWLAQDSRFDDMNFHEYAIEQQVYQRLKIKIKNEIITLRKPGVDVTQQRAPAVSPAQLKQWLDEKRDITLLDTRNDFEVGFGTFENAVNLHLNNFGEFPEQSTTVDKQKPVVMFCTGGIRCEKAALYMLGHGYQEVYQLDGGILGYFNQVGGAHYQGGCYVFDERESVSPESRV